MSQEGGEGKFISYSCVFIRQVSESHPLEL